MGFEAKRIGDDISWAVIAIVAVLTVISVGLLYATAFVDPGFVPRDLEDEAAEEGSATFLLPSLSHLQAYTPQKMIIKVITQRVIAMNCAPKFR